MKLKTVFSLLFILILKFSFAQLYSQQAVTGIETSISTDYESPEKWSQESFGVWDQTQEEKSLRDQNAKHFKNQDGSYSAIIAAGNMHYWENERWNTIFHGIEPSTNGFQNLTNNHKTLYPASSGGAIRTFLPDGNTIRDMLEMRMFFTVSGVEVSASNIKNKPGIVNFNELIYPNAYGPGIDLKFTQHTTKRKMDYLVSNLSSIGAIPNGADYLVFEEKVELPNGWTFSLVENNILILDALGAVKAVYEKPIFNDAPHLDNDGHSHSDEIEGIYAAFQNGTLLTIQTKVQLDWLTDVERIFPVLIDPTVNLYPDNASWWTGHIHTNSGTPTAYTSTSITAGNDNNMRIGKGTNGTEDNNCYHSWAKFNISSIPSTCVNSVNLNVSPYDNDGVIGSGCFVNVSLRPLVSDPVVATNANRLTDIRDGTAYNNIVFNTANESGLQTFSLGASAVTDVLSNLASGWFGVGFNTTAVQSPHYDYLWLRPHSHASKPYITVDYTPNYRVAFSSPTPTTFCASQTQNVSVTVTNTGCLPWTSGGTLPNTVNFSWWGSWQAGGLAGGQDNNPRLQPFINLAPGASQVVTFSVTAPAAPGSYSIQTDLVRDGVCWFRGNSAPSCGPGNVDYVIPITVYDALIVNAGSDLTNCNAGNINLSGTVTPATYSSSASATYSSVNASTLYNTTPTTATNSSCPINLFVNIPAGATITSVSVSYNMTANGSNSAYMSEQRSYLQCSSSGGAVESSIYSGVGNSGGTYNYNRAGLSIANGVVGGGAINFSLHAFRTWGGSGCGTSYNYVNNNSFTVTVYYNAAIPVIWTGSPIVSGANSLTPTVNPTSSTTYTLTATSNGCSIADQVTVTISPSATAPTSITASNPNHPTYCHGNTINLTSIGGTAAGGGVADVWYENSCNTIVEETWLSTPIGRPGWWIGSTTVNSANGILNVTSTGVDPMIYMGNLSINPNVYRYIQVRYRYVSGTANPGMQVFFENGLGLAESRSQRGSMIMDGAWHFMNLDMSVNYSNVNSGWIGGGTVTGLRFDFCESSGMVMEFDFLLVSENRMVGDQTTLTLNSGDTYYPTSSTQYFTRKIDNCGATSCISTNVNFPPLGTNLSLNNESQTCVVNQAGWVHFYHSSGRLIASVNSGGQNLGNVSMTSYVDGAPITVPACNTPNPAYATAYLQRHWVITPTIQPATPVQVRLPYGNVEFSNLSGVANANANGWDDVFTPNDIKLTKYSGPLNVNNNAPDNCPANGGSGGATIHVQSLNGLTTVYSNVNNAWYTDFSIPGFSEFWLHGSLINSPLPITLTSFAAVCEDQNIRVQWATASENNTSHFSIERSIDGTTWEMIATKNAAGNSTNSITYEYLDFEGRGYSTVYYRLQQVDVNGESESFGPTVAQCHSDVNEFLLYPNPAENEVTIVLNGVFEEGNTYFSFWDVNGKIIKTIDYTKQFGKLIQVDLSDFESGVYFVQMHGENNDNKIVKFVKQ